MGTETEAEGLLRSGQLYVRRSGWMGPEGALVFVGVKHGAVSVYWGDEPHLHFDLDGRWQRTFRAGVHYRKGLDGRVVGLARPRVAGRLTLEREELDGPAVSALDAWAAAEAGALRDRLMAGTLRVVEPPSPGVVLGVEEAAGWLDRVTRWDGARWGELARWVHDAGHPWPELPATGEGLLAVQATLGDGRWEGSRTTGRPPEALRVRSVAGFVDHLTTMRSVVGGRLPQYRGIYMAGPDVLEQAPEVVLGWLEAIGRVFPIARGPAPAGRRSDWEVDAVYLGGIEAGVRESSRGPTEAEVWRAYRAAGLSRLHRLEPEGEERAESAAVAAARAAGISLAGFRTRRR